MVVQQVVERSASSTSTKLPPTTFNADDSNFCIVFNLSTTPIQRKFCILHQNPYIIQYIQCTAPIDDLYIEITTGSYDSKLRTQIHAASANGGKIRAGNSRLVQFGFTSD